jgi:hypothetical protein
MNPVPMIKADLRQLGWVAWAIVALIAAAVGINVALLGLERSVRTSATRAADDFDLLIGGLGSPTQLVLTTVYLEPDALPLIGGELLNTLSADPRVAGVAPIILGDVALGYPVVGTTAAFATRWGRKGGCFSRRRRPSSALTWRCNLGRASCHRTRRATPDCHAARPAQAKSNIAIPAAV